MFKRKVLMPSINSQLFVLLILTNLNFINLYSQKKDPKLEFNLATGIQINSGKISNARFEKIQKVYFPLFNLGISFSNKITPKKRFALNFNLHSGKIKRDFNYQFSDSVGTFYYRSLYYYNFISYGFGAQYRYQIYKKIEFMVGLSYKTISVRKMGEDYHWDNSTSANLSYSRIIQSNDFSKNLKYIDINYGLNFKLGKSEKNLISLSCSSSVKQPLYGSSYYEVNNKKIEDNNYKINFSNIMIGYTRVLKL